MKVLIANVGSTSYKYTLFEVIKDECNVLARGGIERVSNYEKAIEEGLEKIKQDANVSALDIDAVAFKTVLGKDVSGLREVDGKVLQALEDMVFVAPAHNPPYIAAIKAFEKTLPKAKRMALFETSFYQYAPLAWHRYAVPKKWHEAGIQRNGFHGASHKYAAERAAELCGNIEAAESAKMLYVNGGRLKLAKSFKVVNCHMGGSSSVCGVLDGAAVGASMGFSPQSGLPQNNRVGDIDVMAVPFAMQAFGISMQEALEDLSKRGGLLGVSGVSNDMRDIAVSAKEGNADAQLAIEVLVNDTKSQIGSFAAQLGGLDCISFSGGIAENNPWIREKIIEGLGFLGAYIDSEKNSNMPKGVEGLISPENAKVKVALVYANEEIVIAREVQRYLSHK